MTNLLLSIVFLFSSETLFVDFISSEFQSQEEMFINKLIGKWNGVGKLMGADAEYSMHWEWVLDKKFVRLTFENRRKQSDSSPIVFNAQGYYHSTGNGDYQGTWFDSRGIVLPFVSKVEDSALITDWGSPETEQGRTVYRVVSENKIEVTDFIKSGDDFRQFGNAVYMKK